MSKIIFEKTNFLIIQIKKLIKKDKRFLQISFFYIIELFLRLVILFESNTNLELYGNFILLLSVSSIISTTFNFGRLQYIISYNIDQKFLTNILFQNFLIAFIFVVILKQYLEINYLIIFSSLMYPMLQFWAFNAKGISCYLARICRLNPYIMLLSNFYFKGQFLIISTLLTALLLTLFIFSFVENGHLKTNDRRQFTGLKFYFSSLLGNLSNNIEKIIPSIFLSSTSFGIFQQIRELCSVTAAIMIPFINEHVLSRPNLSKLIIKRLFIVGVFLSIPLSFLFSLIIDLSKINIPLLNLYFLIAILSSFITIRNLMILILNNKRKFKIDYSIKLISIIFIPILFFIGNIVSKSYMIENILIYLLLYILVFLPYIFIFNKRDFIVSQNNKLTK